MTKRFTLRTLAQIALWCAAGAVVASTLAHYGVIEGSGRKAALCAGVACFGAVLVTSRRSG